MQKKLSEKQINDFRRTVYSHFRRHGRDLPWRHTEDPYQILVSEIMLQQTQVDRTIPKFKEFIKKFPTVHSLARASKQQVLQAWQGMGYNRRVLHLQAAAQEIHSKYKGKVPDTVEALVALPGIGPYTARAILAFAFNQPNVLIETNVRSLYLHHFFQNRKKVSDESLLPLIEQTLDRKHPRKWYSALMDYGSDLKKKQPNPSRRSKHHVKQSRFEGSVRQARGAILRELLSQKTVSEIKLQQKTKIEKKRIRLALESLMHDEMIVKRGAFFHLA